MARPARETARRWKKGTKPRFVGFWLSYMEHAELLSRARADKVTVSDYVRRALTFEARQPQDTDDSSQPAA